MTNLSPARRRAHLTVVLVIAVLAGCARGVAIGSRERIQQVYDALGEAVARGDDTALAHDWQADPAAAGSPIAARVRARDAGRTLVAWSARLHRFRMVGDTAVVDVSVRTVEQTSRSDSSGRAVTSSVVRGFWVEAPDSWRIVRTEPLGPDQVETER